MLKFLTDENYNHDYLRALIRQNPALDIVRAQDTGLEGWDDPTLLAWAAENQRVMLTHDRNTMIGYAYARIRGGQPMPGVFIMRDDLPISRVVDDILTLAECSMDGEWEGQVRYIPLR